VSTLLRARKQEREHLIELLDARPDLLTRLVRARAAVGRPE